MEHVDFSISHMSFWDCMLQESQVFQEADDDDLGSRLASGLVANPVVALPTGVSRVAFMKVWICEYTSYAMGTDNQNTFLELTHIFWA